MRPCANLQRKRPTPRSLSPPNNSMAPSFSIRTRKESGNSYSKLNILVQDLGHSYREKLSKRGACASVASCQAIYISQRDRHIALRHQTPKETQNLGAFFMRTEFCCLSLLQDYHSMFAARICVWGCAPKLHTNRLLAHSGLQFNTAGLAVALLDPRLPIHAQLYLT